MPDVVGGNTLLNIFRDQVASYLPLVYVEDLCLDQPNYTFPYLL
jgi:hypothetical protein